MNEHEVIDSDGLITFLAERLEEHEEAAQDCPEPGKGALLREVAEGRQVIAEYEAATTELNNRISEAGNDGLPAYAEIDGVLVWAPERVQEIIWASGQLVIDWLELGQEVRGRVSIWADHPDYRPEWAPDDDGSVG